MLTCGLRKLIRQVRPSFASAWIAGSSPAMTRMKERKEKKEAERRQTQCFMSAPAGAGRATERSACADPPLRARSPVGVPLTALARGIFHPQRLSFRPGFLGGGRSARSLNPVGEG